MSEDTKEPDPKSTDRKPSPPPPPPAPVSLLTVFVPAHIGADSIYRGQQLQTVPADQVPEGARVIGPPAPVGADGNVAVIDVITGQLSHIPPDAVDLARHARAVANVHVLPA